MENEVLKIINSRLHPLAGHTWLIGTQRDDNETSAKEITEMMMEFIEWIKTDVEGDFPEGVGVLQWNVYAGNMKHIWIDTTEELFNYWRDNIRGK